MIFWTPSKKKKNKYTTKKITENKISHLNCFLLMAKVIISALVEGFSFSEVSNPSGSVVSTMFCNTKSERKKKNARQF